MDKLFVELLSINKLEDVLIRTERIQPNIQKCDKVPSWDGELIVYNSKNINKSNVIGNIRVQVKGSMQQELGLNGIKFQVERSDLENYKKDGGCIFYVIYMKDMDNFKIYYNVLLPFDLKLILDEMDVNQQSKSLYFKEYPMEDIELQLKIYRGFIHNKEKQIGTVDASFKIEQLDRDTVRKIDGFNFTLFNSGADPIDMFNSAFKLPTYLYANIMDGKISIPVQKMTFSEIRTCEFPEKVCLNGKCYFDSIRMIKKEDDEQILFGKGFCCSQKEGKLSFNLNGTLSERIKDLNFLLILCKSEKKVLTVGDSYKVEFNNGNLFEDVRTKEQNLIYMVRVSAALKCIGVTDDLDCDNLTEIDNYSIEALLNSVIGGKALILENDIQKVIKIEIANIVFPVVTECVGDNAYKLESLFNKQDVVISVDSDQEVSVHLLMGRFDFLEISNINYDIIKNEITKMVYSEKIDPLLTKFILEALIAYDQNQKIDLYNCVLEISKWQVDNVDSDIHNLNMLQIIKRKQNFCTEEILKLNKIKNESDNIEIKLGACILLESKSEIEMYWNVLDEETKIRFKAFPIYYFIDREYNSI